nr:Lrp/AsnC family transcriptional regulator [Mesorhizobium sp.]
MKSKLNTVRLDAWDLRILAELQGDGRISKSELAKRVHLSASACSERLRILETTGIVEGYYARLSPSPTGGVIFVMVEVVLDRHRIEDQRHFETAIQGVSEILDCWAIGGAGRLPDARCSSFYGCLPGIHGRFAAGWTQDRPILQPHCDEIRKIQFPIPLSAPRQR